MKTIIFSFLTLIAYTSVNAQITISHYDMPAPNNVFMYHNTVDLASEDFSLTGAAYNWDYSSATSSGNDTLNIVAVGSTPFAYQLYFNNPFQYPDYLSDYAITGQDIDAFGQVSITERFNYFKVNGNSLEVTGFGANVNGIPASVKYDTIDQQYPFLMSYNMTPHTSSGSYILSVPTFGTYGQWIRRVVEADGWGSLATPNYTYPEVLRVKTTLEQRDTVFVDQFSIGQTIDRPTEVIYEWFTNTDNTPVMSVSMSGGQVTNVKYLAPIAAGVDETSQDLNIAAIGNGVFEIKNSASIQQIKIYNIEGKEVVNESQNKSVINLSKEPKGMYLIKIQMKDKTTSINKVIR